MLQTGEVVFDKYRVLGLLGKGGMGNVYLAENINVGNKWAIKEIMRSKSRPIDLMVEPEMLKKLNHPNLPRIIDVISTRESIYIIEDYFAGQSLQQALEDRQLCSEVNVVKWCRQLAEILIYLHNLKPTPIIYSDLKPSNIIIDNNNSLKLVDFGIARETSGSSGQGVFGSRGYAAPEQYEGVFDERTDIYSFGASFFHVLTGKRYDKDHPIQLRQVNPDFSAGIDHIINQCLQEKPQLRYQSAAELYKDITLIDHFSRAYKRRAWKKRLTAAGITAVIMLGCITVMVGLESMQETKGDLYQQKIDTAIRLTSDGKYEAAEASFLDALHYGSSSEVYLNLARLYLRENKPSQAADFLSDKIQSGIIKNDLPAAYLMGTAYFDMKDYESAVACFQQALQLSTVSQGKEYEQTMRDMAVSYSRMGRYGEADSILANLTIGTDANSPLINYVRGEIQLAQNNYPESGSYFDKALQEDSQNNEYRLGAGRMFSAWSTASATPREKIEKLSRAQQILQEGIAIDPYNIQILSDYGLYSYDLGQLYESIGDNASRAAYEEARTAFVKLKDLGMADSNTYLNLALVYDKLDDYASADACFLKSLHLDEGSSHTNFIYALFKLKHKQYTQAYEYLQKTVDLNKNSYEVSAARSKIAELKEKGWI